LETDRELLASLSQTASQIKSELAKVIVGQNQSIDSLLISLFAGGHCLLVGVPGLAKTLMISSLSKVLDLQFSRIQFTPDLMPSDITGTEVMRENRDTGERSFRFLPGPVLANLVLADEINRAPPKTQAALLEAMQERQVTVAGECHKMPLPFWVLATQNPIEQEGTYPLPEAQLDRFMLQVLIDYPSEEEELDVIMQTTSDERPVVTAQVDSQRLLELMSVVKRISLTENVARYAMQIVRKSRPNQNPLVRGRTENSSQNANSKREVGSKSPRSTLSESIAWGAGPRGGQNLVLAAKARAAIDGRAMVLPDDIDAVAKPVLRHRIRTNFMAETEGITPETIIDELIATTKMD
jgi:MoxR-like ATPase